MKESVPGLVPFGRLKGVGSPSRNEQHRNRREELGNGPRECDAVNPRHFNVRDQRIRGPAKCFQGLNGFIAVAGFMNTNALCL